MNAAIPAGIVFIALVVALIVSFYGGARPRVFIEDPTEDLPVVPEPSVCPVCEGDFVIGDEDRYWPCFNCCCEVCWKPTDTPPLCAECSERQADEDAARAYREGRYE